MIFSQKIRCYNHRACVIFYALSLPFFIAATILLVAMKKGSFYFWPITTIITLEISAVPYLFLMRSVCRQNCGVAHSPFKRLIEIDYYNDRAAIKKGHKEYTLYYNEVQSCRLKHINRRSYGRYNNYTFLHGFGLIIKTEGCTLKLYTPPDEYNPTEEDNPLRRLYNAIEFGTPIYESDMLYSGAENGTENESEHEFYSTKTVFRPTVKLMTVFLLLLAVLVAIIIYAMGASTKAAAKSVGAGAGIFFIPTFIAFALMFPADTEKYTLKLHDNYFELITPKGRHVYKYSEVDRAFSFKSGDNMPSASFFRLMLLDGTKLEFKTDYGLGGRSFEDYPLLNEAVAALQTRVESEHRQITQKVNY